MISAATTSIQYIKGVGPARKRTFANLGVETVEDLLYLFPRRYEDRSKLTPIAQVRAGEVQTITGTVKSKGARRSWYTKKHVSEAVIDDGSGRITVVWFNQPYLERYFKPETRVVLYGRVDVYKKRLQMVSPEYEILDREDEGLNAGRIVPVYPLTRGITQRYLRRVMRNCLDKYLDGVEDLLPVSLRNRHRLYNIHRSLENVHFPASADDQAEAHRRVSFEEFFFFQIAVSLRRQSIVAQPGIAHAIDADFVRGFFERFPFTLTGAQKRVVHEIARDLKGDVPMLRLLQGDVGSGKTIVALFGCLAAAADGHQAVVLAPTEILARQHYENIAKLLGIEEEEVDGSKPGSFVVRRSSNVVPRMDSRVSGLGSQVQIHPALLVGGLKKKEREAALERIASGEGNLIVGTHALLGEKVNFKDLSFAVIDEQHKFGVRQRALLAEKGHPPDVLVMTATPIPRTLSLTLFGDLDVSVIDEMPPGRGKVKTRVVPAQQEGEVYKFVRDQVAVGQQAFIVYPIVDESDKLELKAAEAMFARFRKEEFKDIPIGLVHGQMKREAVEETMAGFKRNEIKVLVATTVLEVGVDVPNANVMVIEHAERFGLAQLHQLRGRVGRGSEDAHCWLIADPSTADGEARLRAISKTTDGFKIAEEDLLIRGPGHYFGRHQHGLNELRFANPVTQVEILQAARKEAEELIHRDPRMQEEGHAVLARIVRGRYPGYLAMTGAG